MFGWLRVHASRIRGWFSARKLDEDFSRELDAHLDLLTEQNIRQGMTPEEARRSAHLRLGGTTQLREAHQELAGLPMAETIVQDVRYAIRTLRKSPGFALVCVLTLGLGIGASSAIFSVVNGVLLRPLPYPKSGRLLRIEESHPGDLSANLTYASYLDLEHESKLLEDISSFRPWSFNVTGEGEPEQISGALVSGSFFSALGIQAHIGRTINLEDDRAGGDNRVIVLSYSLWQSRFASDQEIIGKILRVNAEDYRVIGVMPRGFDYPDKSRVWCPLVPDGALGTNRRAHLLTVIGDVRPGASAESIQGELTQIAEQIEKQNPGVDPDILIKAISLKENMVAPVQPALLILIFAVCLLLLIACANLANLLLARAESRQREFAVRMAIGAGRTRLGRQLVTENLVMASLGAVLGLGIAWQSLRFIVALNAENMPRFGEISLDWRAVAFTLLLTLLTGLLIGLAPVLVGTKTNLTRPLKNGVCMSAGKTRYGPGQALVVPQFALAVVILVGAGLVGNSFVRLLRVHPGFNQSGLLTIELFLSPVEYPEGDPKGPVVLRQMLESIRSIQGLRSVGMVNALPITGGPATDFVIEGRPAPPANDEPSADIRTADSGYFRTMGIPLLVGREFTDHENEGAARVLVINQTMARQYWPAGNPIGQRITMKDWGPPLTGEIVGIVGDVKTNGLDVAVGPMIYWPYSQFPQLFNTIVVRSDGDPARLVPALKGAIWSIDKNQPISRIETFDEILSESLARRRLYMILLGIFSGAALLLAAVGIYGMVSYSVSKRTHELGIRLAIGAGRRDVLLLVLGQAASVALLGMIMGIGAALVLTRLMSNILYGVSTSDPSTFAAGAVILAIVAALASYIPARRAMGLDPMVALRHE
jgi:predicted permease